MSSTTAAEQDLPEDIVPAPREPIDWQPWLWGGLLVLLVLLVYWPTLGNGYIWDDETHILGNVTLRSAEGLYNMWFKWGAIPQYYPLVHTTLWIEYQLWGFDPHGYHLVNMFWHAAGVVLLWRLLLRLKVPGAWLAAAIFAVHPVCVESVAWVSELKNVQSLALALASMLVFLRYAPPEEPADAKRSTQGWDYELSLGLFVAALLSKTVTAVVPAVLLVIYWWKRGRVTWRDVTELMPMFLFGAAMASITVWLETTLVGAEGAEWNFTPAERLLIGGRALWFYVGKLVWPHPLVFFYPRFSINAQATGQYLFPLAAVGALIGLWAARKRLGRGPLAAALIFVIGVAPALGFFNVYPFRYALVADHFQYQAAIALIALAAAILTIIGQNLPRGAAMAAGALLLVPLAVVAHQKTRVYENLETLYTDILTYNPQSWVAHINLADYLDHRGRVDESIPHYREGLEYLTKSNWRRGNLGRALELTGQVDDGIAQFEQDLTGELTDKERAEIHRLLGDLLVLAHRNDEAIKHFESSLELEPENALTLSNYGQVLIDNQDVESGLEMLEKSVKLNPNNARAQLRLGKVLRGAGRLDEALPALIQSVNLNPSDAKAREELAAVLLIKGDVQNAVPQLQQALILDPQSADGHYLLGTILAGAGQLELAAKELEGALQLNPDHLGAKMNLEKVREAQKLQAAKNAPATSAAPAASTTPDPAAATAPAEAAPPATASPVPAAAEAAPTPPTPQP